MYLLKRLFEHNNWGNQEIIKACAKLDDSLMDQSLADGKMTIRELLSHLVGSQTYYLATIGGEQVPLSKQASLDELATAEAASSAGLLAMADEFSEAQLQESFEKNGNAIEKWVVLVQAHNHGAEHRKDIRMIMLANGVEPPRTDGWMFGGSVGAISPAK